ncbi:MAG: magnesium chelatase subunit D family protein [Promethearchaeota archaeon]
MTHYKTYPFTAIVGQEMLKMSLILNAINPKIGGVLIKGTKGTAKSTAVRSLADLLPKIKVIKNCVFNCNPEDDKEACHSCLEKKSKGFLKKEDIEYKKMRVINLPINATEDRIIGSIDIQKALVNGLKSLEPGILAEANRNILYIDEVNLLSDNLGDVLLDSAAMGVNIIEREGISLHHPSNFILVGTMNPEEGNLRPQLLDRFGLCVEVSRIEDLDQRVDIMKYTEEHHENPHEFYEKFAENQKNLRNKIINARELLKSVQISDEYLKKIAQICLKFQTDGHRADITINRTAKTLSAYNGRTNVIEDDIKMAAKLALNHRLRRLPFEDQCLDEQEIENLFEDNKEELNNNSEENLDKDVDGTKKLNTREEIFDIDEKVKFGQILKEKKVREVINTSGQRILHPTNSPRGKYIGGQKPRNYRIPLSSDISINETLNEASLAPENRSLHEKEAKIIVKEEHIRIKKRMGKSSFLIIFCVDASGSMGAGDRMKAIKAIVFSILQENYIHRDKVSLVIFRKDKAEVVLPPTRSTDLAHKLLKEIPTGGTTPLLAGLSKAMDIALEEIRKKTGYIPLIILISDARENVYNQDPVEEVLKIGEMIAKYNLNLIVIDTENLDVRLRLCKKLARAANAEYHHIDKLNENVLHKILTIEGIIENE